MARKNFEVEDRRRQLLAQEAARIIVDHGIRDYRVAKVKAAERLGLGDRRSLPGNAEIELAVSEHLRLFGREAHASLLALLREAAISAMEFLVAWSPRLVGPVLNGTADTSSAVNLHVFSDSAEEVALHLDANGVSYRSYERRLRSHRNRKAQPSVYPGYRFDHRGTTVEATVFPVDGIRQAPVSPVDGRPMQRADVRAVRALLAPGS